MLNNIIYNLSTILAHPELANKSHETFGYTLLHVAAMHDKLDFVKFLTKEHDAPVNAKYTWTKLNPLITPITSLPFVHINGATVLHYACLAGNWEMIKVLLKAGAEWTLSDNDGRIPEWYIRTSLGDEGVKLFKKLCEEEDNERQYKLTKSPRDEREMDRKAIRFRSSCPGN